jgi:hypothetical protein
MGGDLCGTAPPYSGFDPGTLFQEFQQWHWIEETPMFEFTSIHFSFLLRVRSQDTIMANAATALTPIRSSAPSILQTVSVRTSAV